MIPILYGYGTTDFNNNGLGRMSDALSCTVPEEVNGKYEAEITYPLDGYMYDEINGGCTVKLLANDKDEPQLFDIYTINRNLNTITAKLRHVSYRLGGYLTRTVSGTRLSDLFAMFPTRIYSSNLPFHFHADYDPLLNGYNSKTYRSVRSVLMDEKNSILTEIGGEWHFDNFNVRFVQRRGEDNGVSIVYGKNLLNLDATEDISNVYTHIQGTWQKDTGASAGSMLPTGFVLPFERTLQVDVTNEFDTRPSQAQIDAIVWQHVGDVGNITQSINASFLHTGEPLEPLRLGDTVNVIHPRLKIGYKQRVSSVVFDSLTERYTDINVGTKVQTLAETLEKMRRALK